MMKRVYLLIALLAVVLAASLKAASTVYWVGNATAVAQVSTVELTDYDANTTYKITIGGQVVSQVGIGGTVETTAAGLWTNLTASTHPYFEAVTWTLDGAIITGTASVPGVPFTATSSVAGGYGTIGAVTQVTASAGPNDWSTAANWSGGAVPVNTNLVVIKDSAANICWGLDQSAVTLGSLKIHKTYTGVLGLDRTQFATTSDGATFSTTAAAEYRGVYLQVGITAAQAVTIGENLSASAPAGSGRLMLNFGSTAPAITILGTASVSTDGGKPALRLLTASASATLTVRSAPGGVGVAVDAAGETSTIGTITVSDATQASRVFVGSGTTLTTWSQVGGSNLLQCAATLTTCTVSGGLLQIEGDYTITTVTLNGGVVTDNHVKTGGNAITTLNLNGGTMDGTQSSAARTWATVNLKAAGTLLNDGTVVTITSLVQYAGRYKLTGASY